MNWIISTRVLFVAQSVAASFPLFTPPSFLSNRSLARRACGGMRKKNLRRRKKTKSVTEEGVDGRMKKRGNGRREVWDGLKAGRKRNSCCGWKNQTDRRTSVCSSADVPRFNLIISDDSLTRSLGSPSSRSKYLILTNQDALLNIPWHQMRGWKNFNHKVPDCNF